MVVVSDIRRGGMWKGRMVHTSREGKIGEGWKLGR